MKAISVDTETLALSATPLMLAIGAVAFDPFGNDTVESLREQAFYTAIKPACQQEEFGRDIDGDTVFWWMGQPDAARNAIVGRQKEACHLIIALHRFSEWITEQAGEGARLWSHGAAEDAVWLRSAFEATSTRFPIHYRNVRDTRTLFELMDTPEIEVPGLIDHYALDDAIYQALRVQHAHRQLKSLKSLEAIK